MEVKDPSSSEKGKMLMLAHTPENKAGSFPSLDPLR